MNTKTCDSDTLKAKIKLMASVQTDCSTPQTMDIGELEFQDEDVEAVGMQKETGGRSIIRIMLDVWWGATSRRRARKATAKVRQGSGEGREKGKGKRKLSGPTCETFFLNAGLGGLVAETTPRGNARRRRVVAAA